MAQSVNFWLELALYALCTQSIKAQALPALARVPDFQSQGAVASESGGRASGKANNATLRIMNHFSVGSIERTAEMLRLLKAGLDSCIAHGCDGQRCVGDSRVCKSGALIQPTRVLSYGCAYGDEAIFLSQEFKDSMVFCTDISEQALVKARTKTREESRITVLPMGDIASYDVIFCMYVLFKNIGITEYSEFVDGLLQHASTLVVVAYESKASPHSFFRSEVASYFASRQAATFSTVYLKYKSSAGVFIAVHQKRNDAAVRVPGKPEGDGGARIQPQRSSSICFFTIADASYLTVLSSTISAFVNIFHVDQAAITLGCMDTACSAFAASHGVQHFPPMNAGRLAMPLGVRVSHAKFAGLCTLLRSQRYSAVVNFDADVFFFANPTVVAETLLSGDPFDPNLAPIQLIVQPDHLPAKARIRAVHPRPRLNFGLFAARRSNFTATLFTTMWREYNASGGRWDQEIFNTVLAPHVQTRVSLLPLEKHVLFHVDVDSKGGAAAMRPLQIASSFIASVHMTCVEGPLTKQHLAKTFYGWLDVGGYYTRPRKTIAYSRLSYYAHHSDYIVEWARLLQRDIRVSDIVPNLSVEKLSRLNVSLVEQNYWSRVRAHLTGFRETVSADVNASDADEIVLVPPASIANQTDQTAPASSFLCNDVLHKDKAKRLLVQRNASGCLKWCDRAHF